MELKVDEAVFGTVLALAAVALILLTPSRQEPDPPPLDTSAEVVAAEDSAGPAAACPAEGTVQSAQLPCIWTTPASAEERCLDALRLCALDVDAVCVEADLYLYWLNEDREGVRAACMAAAEELEYLKATAAALDVPEVCQSVHEAFISLTEGLGAAFTAAAGDRTDHPSSRMAATAQLWSAFGAQVDRFRLDFTTPEAAPINKPAPPFADLVDSSLYAGAIGMIESGRYRQAYLELTALAERYPDDDFILLHRADCLSQVTFGEERWQDGVTDGDPQEEALEALERVVNREGYSPLAFEAFVKWRALKQSHWHGVSNFSDIPNEDYNETRRRLVQQIDAHLAAEPDDVWARAQKDLLIGWPNIKRGGTMGNTGLQEWGLLFARSVLESVFAESSDGEPQ